MAEIKVIAGTKRQRLRDVIPLDTPYSIYFFPTNLCNFRCKYCAHAGGLKQFEEEYGLKPESMSIATFQRAVDQLKEFPQKIKSVNLSGQGEPLLNVDLAEMIAYAKKAGIAEKIEMITNASLLSHETAEKLISAGLDCIRISLQGMSSEKYQEVCGHNLDFEELAENISYMFSIRKQCRIYIKVMDISLENGDEEIFYKTFEHITDRMYVEKCKPVYDGVEATRELETETDRYGRKHKPRMVCPLPFYMLGILPDGTVSPCETIYVPETLGNVWESRLIYMWNGETMRNFRKLQMDKKRKMNAKCARCCAPDDVSHPEDDLD